MRIATTRRLQILYFLLWLFLITMLAFFDVVHVNRLWLAIISAWLLSLKLDLFLSFRMIEFRYLSRLLLRIPLFYNCLYHFLINNQSRRLRALATVNRSAECIAIIAFMWAIHHLLFRLDPVSNLLFIQGVEARIFDLWLFFLKICKLSLLLSYIH